MGRQKDLFRTPSSSSCGMSTERRSAGCYPACASHGSAASESSQCFEYSIRSGLRWDYARARSHGWSRQLALEYAQQSITSNQGFQQAWAEAMSCPPQQRPDPALYPPSLETVTRIIDAAEIRR